MEGVQATCRHRAGAGHRQKNMEEVQVIDRKTWRRCRSQTEKHGGGAGHMQTRRMCRSSTEKNMEEVQAIDRKKTWGRCRP